MQHPVTGELVVRARECSASQWPTGVSSQQCVAFIGVRVMTPPSSLFRIVPSYPAFERSSALKIAVQS